MPKLCWTLNHATEGIGREYPQHQRMSAGYDYHAPNSVYQLPSDALPDFEPNFDSVVIHGHARLTDLLSSSPTGNTGLLVSDRLRSILGRFSLPPHRFYPVRALYRRRAIEGYHWLQLPAPPLCLPEDAPVDVVEGILDSDPDLAALDLLRLDRPARFAYRFLSGPLRLTMESARITGVRFGRSKLYLRASARPSA